MPSRRPFELEVVPEPGRTTVTWRDPGAWMIGAGGAGGLGALLMVVSALGIANKKPTPYGPIVCAFVLLLMGAWLFWNGRTRRVRVVMTPETIDSSLGIREPLEGVDFAETKSVAAVEVAHETNDPARKNGWQVRLRRDGAPTVMLALFRSSEPATELSALIKRHLARYPTAEAAGTSNPHATETAETPHA
ncbi:MAG TPA: hypothetical protein VGM90_16550 [Kofleriaceae bacterium]